MATKKKTTRRKSTKKTVRRYRPAKRAAPSPPETIDTTFEEGPSEADLQREELGAELIRSRHELEQLRKINDRLTAERKHALLLLRDLIERETHYPFA